MRRVLADYSAHHDGERPADSHVDGRSGPIAPLVGRSSGCPGITTAQRVFMKRFLAFLCPLCLLAADNSIRGFPPNSISSEQSWEAKAQAIPDPQRVRNTIQKLADKPHLAGTPASKAVAEYLAGQLR